jgi:hypothetical protein
MTFNSPEWCKARDESLLQWCNGDRNAAAFVMDIVQLAEVWDDIIDGDPLDMEQVEQAMLAGMVRLPLNPFYRRHGEYLTPLIIQAINTWKVANVLSKGDRNQRAVAYTLRHMDLQIVLAVIELTSGKQAALDIGPELWTRYAARADDGIDDWLSGDAT